LKLALGKQFMRPYLVNTQHKKRAGRVYRTRFPNISSMVHILILSFFSLYSNNCDQLSKSCTISIRDLRYTHTHTHTHRERERQRQREYMTERGRERERERERERDTHCLAHFKYPV
jgi:hypothetical protein